MSGATESSLALMNEGPGRLMRRFLLASLAAAALIAAIPSGASAATQIGDVFVPDKPCGGNQTKLQSISPAAQYEAPSDGVITRWEFIAAATPPTDLRFKTARPTGTVNEFLVTGQSVLEDDVLANTLNSYPTQISVLAGDIIGFFNMGTGNCLTNPAAGYTYHSFAADVQPGVDEVFAPNADNKLDVRAFLELDCDKDGLGDETQDSFLPCGPAGALVQPLTCRGEPLTISGTRLGDTIVGTNGRDVIGALNGDDEVIALDGNDVVCGNDGRDKLRGQDGEDKIKGNRGADRLKGGFGDDRLRGNRGEDTLKGKAGDDTLNGGRNNDTCRGGAGDNKITNCES